MLNILLHTKVLTSRKNTQPKTATYMNRQFIKESQVCVDRWIYIYIYLDKYLLLPVI